MKTKVIYLYSNAKGKQSGSLPNYPLSLVPLILMGIKFEYLSWCLKYNKFTACEKKSLVKI